MKEIKMYKLPVIKNSHRDVNFCTRNVINNTVITTYAVRWVLDLSGGSLYKLNKCLLTMLYT